MKVKRIYGYLGVFFGEMFYLCFTHAFYLYRGKTELGDMMLVESWPSTLQKKRMQLKKKNYEQLYDGGGVWPQEESE